MHSESDVVSEEALESRLATLGGTRALRAVYFGRFVARKGVRHAARVVVQARRLGANVELHLYGGGPDEASLRREIAELGAGNYVRFHGTVEYGKEFISRLATYDLLLFLPTEEDTPRMVYDAMAAGLPVLGTRIPFLRRRVNVDGIGVLVDVGDIDAAAHQLRQFTARPALLHAMSHAARAAGRRHTVETWYARRADWTEQAIDRHRQRMRSCTLIPAP
jgi:glycosyltransferase involved in cell wall biosynthesis